MVLHYLVIDILDLAVLPHSVYLLDARLVSARNNWSETDVFSTYKKYKNTKIQTIVGGFIVGLFVGVVVGGLVGLGVG